MTFLNLEWNNETQLRSSGEGRIAGGAAVAMVVPSVLLMSSLMALL